MSISASGFTFLNLSDSQNDAVFTSQCGHSSAIAKSHCLHFANPLHAPSSYRSIQNHIHVTRCSGAESPAKPVTDAETSFYPKIADNDGGDGSDGGGNGGGGGDDGEDDNEEKEFGRILKFEEVMRETENRGASLPSDMWEAAKTTGIREVILYRYLDLQVSLAFHSGGLKYINDPFFC